MNDMMRCDSIQYDPTR